MGTYTTNYQLYMPTVGEQGWGTLVNGNFTTIDTTMKSLDTRLTVVENEVNGALSCTSVTTSGKVTANGGIGTTSLTTSSTITSTGKVTVDNVLQCQKIYVDGRILTTKMSNYSPAYAETSAQTVETSCSSSSTGTSSTITASAPTIKSITYPVRVGCATYIPAATNIKSGSVGSVSRSVTLTVNSNSDSGAKNTIGRLYVNGTSKGDVKATLGGSPKTATYTITSGDKIYVTATGNGASGTAKAVISAATTHYLDGI